MKTILVVEDDAVVRKVIRDALQREYEVLEASGYSEAANHLHKPLDLAIIDYNLPGRDGFEVLKAVREKNPAVLSVIITAYGSESVAIRALRTQVTDYIKKPFSLSNLRKRVAGILEGKRCDEIPETTGRRKEFIIEHIAEYMEDYYKEEITLDRLSRIACIDRYKLCRAFKERFGQNFKSYLNTIRVKNAEEKLKNPDLSITDIALDSGYGSVDHFIRIFKAAYGVPPREYRNRQIARRPQESGQF